MGVHAFNTITQAAEAGTVRSALITEQVPRQLWLHRETKS